MADQSYSMKGWNIKTWAFKNKENIRLLVAALGGFTTTLFSGMDPKWSVPLGGLVSVLLKLGLDSLDYYVSD